jgi:hypothetical protein
MEECFDVEMMAGLEERLEKALEFSRRSWGRFLESL